MSVTYKFERRGRTTTTAVTLAAVYTLLAAALFFLQMSQWVILAGFVFTIPALWDLIADPKSGFSIDEDGVHWFHGKNSATIDPNEIELFKIDLRMDRSVKLTLNMKNGRRIRVTQPSIPPLNDLESVLEQAGYAHRKNPFSLL